ncbi:glycine cleavage T C-terminal barrel domain-containing protein [Mesorhizobium sp. M0187]|uniref:glycine cleavage T C-terminal barrel domain-containing protein n=1 Tax=Mesorhizobium sp. M0187 TaxID=2956908 RepID=UPI00333CA651
MSAARIVTLEFCSVDADASGFEPVWHKGRRVGFVTSSGYGYTIGKSVALALLDDEFAGEGTALWVHIVGGVERPARIIPARHTARGQGDAAMRSFGHGR